MKIFFLLTSLAFFLSGATVSAQTSSRHGLDNFGLARGVIIETPPIPPAFASNRQREVGGTQSASTDKIHTKLALFSHARPNLLMTASQSLDGFTTGNSKIDGLIAAAGARHGVDPVLLYAIMHRESAFKQRAVSYKGARGLMQLMPATAARFGVRDIFDPAQNIEGGTRYVRYLLNFFGGDVPLALAGYNAGEGAVLKYGRRVPPYRETQEYVRRIGERYALMRSPQTAFTAPSVTTAQMSVIEATETPSVTLYERQVGAVRLPDGKFRLVSQ